MTQGAMSRQGGHPVPAPWVLRRPKVPPEWTPLGVGSPQTSVNLGTASPETSRCGDVGRAAHVGDVELEQLLRAGFTPLRGLGFFSRSTPGRGTESITPKRAHHRRERELGTEKIPGSEALQPF